MVGRLFIWPHGVSAVWGQTAAAARGVERTARLPRPPWHRSDVVAVFGVGEGRFFEYLRDIGPAL
jgi:hypothetical protein